jgi:hypothetical protein
LSLAIEIFSYRSHRGRREIIRRKKQKVENKEGEYYGEEQDVSED